MVRDLIRQIQNLRKDSGLKVEDRIEIGVLGADEFQNAVQSNQSYFMNEVLGVKLDFQNAYQKPIRHVLIKLIDSQTNSTVETTYTDSNGNYHFTVDSLGSYVIKVFSQNMKSDYFAPLMVKNNSQCHFISRNVDIDSNIKIFDIIASSGWKNNGYTEPREAGAFVLFDIITHCCEVFKNSKNDIIFPLLYVIWSPGTTDGSYYTTIGAQAYIYILGDAINDSDEYDISVIVHEWIHFFNNSNLSRADNIGGYHSFGEKLDSRIAYGEGLATGFSGIIWNRYYKDTGAASNWGGFYIDLENNYAYSSEHGWFNEATIAKFIYDIWDDSNDAADNISLNIDVLIDTLTDDMYKNSFAFTNIFLFTHVLKQKLDVAGNNSLQPLLQYFNIDSDNEWGMNLDGQYVDMGMNNNVTIQVKKTVANRSNLQETIRYIKKNITNSGTYRISSNSSYVDIEVYLRGIKFPTASQYNLIKDNIYIFVIIAKSMGEFNVNVEITPL